MIDADLATVPDVTSSRSNSRVWVERIAIRDFRNLERVDLVLALTDRRYLNALQHYRANLVRRNAALRDAARRGGRTADERVAVWEPALAEHGTVLIEARAKWVEDSAAEFTHLSEMIGEQ